MCLLTLHTWKSKMTTKSFESAFRANPDWVGFLIIRDWKIEIIKELDFNKALEIYKWINNFTRLVVHFRLWTSWWKDLDMVHPFHLWDNTYLFHNGVFAIDLIEWKSDTASLREYIKELNLTNEQLLNTKAIDLIFNGIRWYNKFLVINKNQYKIYNKHLWTYNTNNDIWYSNTLSLYGKKDYIDEEFLLHNYTKIWK
jgi:hypothetical protein